MLVGNIRPLREDCKQTIGLPLKLEIPSIYAKAIRAMRAPTYATAGVFAAAAPVNCAGADIVAEALEDEGTSVLGIGPIEAGIEGGGVMGATSVADGATEGAGIAVAVEGEMG